MNQRRQKAAAPDWQIGNLRWDFEVWQIDSTRSVSYYGLSTVPRRELGLIIAVADLGDARYKSYDT